MKEILLSIANNANKRYERNKKTTPKNAVEENKPKRRKSFDEVPPNFRTE